MPGVRLLQIEGHFLRVGPCDRSVKSPPKTDLELSTTLSRTIVTAVPHFWICAWLHTSIVSSSTASVWVFWQV